MSRPLWDCPPKLCGTRFSTTAAWFSWTQAKMFPELLCSAAPCTFDISFHPQQNLASRRYLSCLLLNSLYHVTTNTDGYRAMWMLVSSENKARWLLRRVQLCLGFFVLSFKGHRILPYLHTFYTSVNTEPERNGVFLLCLWLFTRIISHKVIHLWIYAACFCEFIIPALTGTNQYIHHSSALIYTHISKRTTTTTTTTLWQTVSNSPVRPYSPLNGFQRKCTCRWRPRAPGSTCWPRAAPWVRSQWSSVDRKRK